MQRYLQAILDLTWSGVDLFFVLSGFLIGGILLDTQKSPNYFKTFYARRFYRIFPIYYVCLAVYFLVSRAPFARLEALQYLLADTFNLAVYAAYIQNIVMAIHGDYGPRWLDITWSLAVEEQFYLILPLLVRFTPRQYLPGLIASAVLLAPALRVLLLALQPTNFVTAYALMPCRADSLGLGVLAALYLRSDHFAAQAERFRRLLWPLAGVMLSGLIALTLFRSEQRNYLLHTVGFTWLALSYATLLLLAILWPETLLGRILRSRVLVEFGCLSYFMYLFHQAILGLCHGLILNSGAMISDWKGYMVTSLSMVFLYILAKVSWMLFERPLVARGHRWRY
jgi:peptidoglycan/LPS O-acetylase OafA/YrhL